MRYFSVAEIAKKWDISERSVRNYCAQNRVDGAFIAGKTWKIPEKCQKTCSYEQEERTACYFIGYLEGTKDKQVFWWDLS